MNEENARNERNEGNNKSNFFNLEENTAAMLTAVIPLGVSMISYVSYAAWAVPLVVMLLEKRSKFVKFCAAQSCALTLGIFVCSRITQNIIDLVGGSKSLLFIPMGIVGMSMSILQIVCLVLLIMLAVKAYKMQVLEIPIVTNWLRKYLS